MNVLLDILEAADFSLLELISLPLRGPFADKLFGFLSFLANYGIIWIVLAIALLFFENTRRTGLAVLIALTLSLLFCNLFLKELIMRPRPFVAHPDYIALLQPTDWSFPSGHTCSCFAAAGAIYGFHRGGGLVALVFAALVGYSRLFLGVHYPTDVLVGMLLGLLIGWCAVRLADFFVDLFYSIRFKGNV